MNQVESSFCYSASHGTIQSHELPGSASLHGIEAVHLSLGGLQLLALTDTLLHSVIAASNIIMFLKYWIREFPTDKCSAFRNGWIKTYSNMHDCVSIAGWGAPSCDAVTYKCSVMHSDYMQTRLCCKCSLQGAQKVWQKKLILHR